MMDLLVLGVLTFFTRPWAIGVVVVLTAPIFCFTFWCGFSGVQDHKPRLLIYHVMGWAFGGCLMLLDIIFLVFLVARLAQERELGCCSLCRSFCETPAADRIIAAPVPVGVMQEPLKCVDRGYNYTAPCSSECAPHCYGRGTESHVVFYLIIVQLLVLILLETIACYGTRQAAFVQEHANRAQPRELHQMPRVSEDLEANGGVKHFVGCAWAKPTDEGPGTVIVPNQGQLAKTTFNPRPEVTNPHATPRPSPMASPIVSPRELLYQGPRRQSWLADDKELFVEGAKIEVSITFMSNSKPEIELRKGMAGKIVKTDFSGDAYVDFFGVGKNQWVFVKNFDKMRLQAGVRPSPRPSLRTSPFASPGSSPKPSPRPSPRSSPPLALEAALVAALSPRDDTMGQGHADAPAVSRITQSGHLAPLAMPAGSRRHSAPSPRYQQSPRPSPRHSHRPSPSPRHHF